LPSLPVDPVDTTVSIRRTVRGSAESIWRALTRAISAWQADEASGVVELGGHLLLAWPTLGAEVDLDVVELEPPHRLVLSAGASLVTFEVEGSTVGLGHSGLMAGDEAEGTRASWQVALATLDQYLAYHDGQPRRTAWAVQRATVSAEAAHVYFTDEAALRAWLTHAGRVDGEGASVSLELGWGERLTGEVLACAPGRDVALSWREQHDSVLVLRTLPAPFSETERLLVATWSCWGREPNPGTTEQLQRSLRRLAHLLSRPAEA
jgi:uncharacterized protein YndB with AHSA1/START domain